MKTQIKNFGKVGYVFSDVRNDTCPDDEKDSLNEKIEEVVVLGYKTQKKEILLKVILL